MVKVIAIVTDRGVNHHNKNEVITVVEDCIHCYNEDRLGYAKKSNAKIS